MWLEKLGGRKFLLALIVLAAGVGVAITQPGKLSAELVSLLLGVVGLFSAGNAVNTFVGSKQAAEAAAVEPTPSPVPEIVSAIENKMLVLDEMVQHQRQTITLLQDGVDKAQKVAAAAIAMSQKKIS